MDRRKHVIVTGGSGRLGAYVVDRLKPAWNVTVLDVAPPRDGDVRHVDVDITDLGGLTQAFEGADAVVHLAAVPNPRTTTPETCFRVNTQGTWAVLQAAEDAGVKRAVVASSDSATGLHHNPKDWAPQYLPVDEEHPIRPSEVYSLSKEVTESICKCFSARGKLEVIALRPSHIVLPPVYPELESRGSDVTNYHLWSFISPEDVAQAFELALNLQDGRYDCFFITADTGLNSRPTLEMFRERFGFDPVLRKPELFKEVPNAGIFDNSRAKRILGFKPMVTKSDFNR